MLTHGRPSRKAWPVEEAAAEIERLGGLEFDPRVVEKFQQLLRQGVLVREAAATSQGESGKLPDLG